MRFASLLSLGALGAILMFLAAVVPAEAQSRRTSEFQSACRANDEIGDVADEFDIRQRDLCACIVDEIRSLRQADIDILAKQLRGTLTNRERRNYSRYQRSVNALQDAVEQCAYDLSDEGEDTSPGFSFDFTFPFPNTNPNPGPQPVQPPPVQPPPVQPPPVQPPPVQPDVGQSVQNTIAACSANPGMINRMQDAGRAANTCVCFATGVGSIASASIYPALTQLFQSTGDFNTIVASLPQNANSVPVLYNCIATN